MMANKRQAEDYDGAWKEALEKYFREFIALFLPQAFDGINWARGFEFLDKELQKVARTARLGKRLVDKLVKVWTVENRETWVLVHTEVQEQRDPGFEKRMYIYSGLLYNRYDREVVSLAVLADQNPAWKPKSFSYERWGCRVSLEFPSVKLLDMEWSELEASKNPFSIIVMAHLKAQATHRDPQGRSRWKLTLAKMLYQRGYSREDILALYRLIDWLMVLPEDLEKRLMEDLTEYEEETKMPHITSAERLGRKEGFLQKSREAVIEVLETRFEAVPQSMVEIINGLEDLSILKTLHKEAVKTASIEDFRQALEKAKP